MAIEPFTPKDFRLFDLPAFADRMAAIRAQVRPKRPDYARAAGETFGALRDCFRLE